MCRLCGCQQFIKEGKQAVIKRVSVIINELQLTPANLDDYECTEVISEIIAPFALRDDEVFETASWISGMHQDVPQANRNERYQAHEQAFRDIFSCLPAQGDPRHIATAYHQLEQLARQLDGAAITSLPPEIQQTVRAVNHVHDDRTRQARLKERYHL